MSSRFVAKRARVRVVRAVRCFKLGKLGTVLLAVSPEMSVNLFAYLETSNGPDALPGRRRMTLPRTRRVRPHKGADARGRPSTTTHAFSPDWFRTPYPPPPLGEHSLVALAAFIATAARGGEAGHSGVDGGEGVVEGER